MLGICMASNTPALQHLSTVFDASSSDFSNEIQESP